MKKKLWVIPLFALALVLGLAACNFVGTPDGGDGHVHSYSIKNVDEEYLKTPASETDPAEYYYSCTCGEKGTETFTFGNALGDSNGGDGAHVFRTEWTVDDEKHWQSCIDLSCDVRKNEENHTFGDWIIDEEATCVRTGIKHRTCAVCGKSVSESIPVNSNAHIIHERTRYL